jgi:hypothetical protein
MATETSYWVTNLFVNGVYGVDFPDKESRDAVHFANTNQLEKLKQLVDEYGNTVLNSWVGLSSASAGHVDVLRYYVETSPELDLNGMLEEAIYCRRINCVRYLCECEWADSILQHRSSYISADIPASGISMCGLAATMESLECLDYLYKRGYKFTPDEMSNSSTNLCGRVALQGNLSILRYLHESAGLELYPELMSTFPVVVLKCVQYLHRSGVMLDQSLYYKAFEGNHSVLVEYLIMNGVAVPDYWQQFADRFRPGLWAVLEKYGIHKEKTDDSEDEEEELSDRIDENNQKPLHIAGCKTELNASNPTELID